MRQLMFLWALLIALFALMGLFGSCKTTTKVEKENVYVHDTLVMSKTDTFTMTKYLTLYRDSFIHDSVIIVKNEKGDTIYKEVIVDRKVNNDRNDNTNTYKAKHDTITKVRDSIVYKDREIVKTKNNYKGWWAFAFLALACLLFVTIRIIIKYYKK